MPICVIGIQLFAMSAMFNRGNDKFLFATDQPFHEIYSTFSKILRKQLIELYLEHKTKLIADLCLKGVSNGKWFTMKLGLVVLLKWKLWSFIRYSE